MASARKRARAVVGEILESCRAALEQQPGKAVREADVILEIAHRATCSPKVALAALQQELTDEKWSTVFSLVEPPKS